MSEAVIVSTARTPLAKSFRGSFNQTHGSTLGGHAIRHAVQRAGLDPAEVESIEREAARVADPEMQVVVRRLLTNERKRAAWRRARGYRECAACGALHSGLGEICPACCSEAAR